MTLSASGCEGTSPFVIGSDVLGSNTGILSSKAGLQINMTELLDTNTCT